MRWPRFTCVSAAPRRYGRAERGPPGDASKRRRAIHRLVLTPCARGDGQDGGAARTGMQGLELLDRDATAVQHATKILLVGDASEVDRGDQSEQGLEALDGARRPVFEGLR